MTLNVDEEIEKLKVEIARLGKVQPDGSICVKFGTLFNDDRCANIFEALVGTLRAAKKRKLLKFDGELLLQGVHDNVDVLLFNPSSKKPDKKPAGIPSKPALSAGESTLFPAKTTLAPIKATLTPSKPPLKVFSG